MSEKTVKIQEDTHEELIETADKFGFKVAAFTDLCIKFACGHFREKGISLDRVNLGLNARYREKLVEDSAAMAKRGIKEYSEWLSMQTPQQQEILKHCSGIHKQEAIDATARKKMEQSLDTS